MNSQQYWRQRILYQKRKELRSAAEYELAMKSRLKDLEHEFEKEAMKYIQRYATENNVSLKQAASVLNSVNNHKWSMSLKEFEAKAKAGGYTKVLNSEYYRSRIARLQDLHQQLGEVAKKYSATESIRMRDELANVYQNTYLSDWYVHDKLEGKLTVNVNHFNEQQLESIVYQPWQGSNFSDRIWHNYTNVLPEVLTDSLMRSTVMEYSPSRAIKDFRDRFTDVSSKNVHRLIITELGHIAEQATAKFYEDSDIDQYQYLATLESHTCDECAHLDERIFYVKDKVEGKNYPLMHPYCRCTTVPYIKGITGGEDRWYRDPITGQGKWTKDMTFKEWKEKQGIKKININDTSVEKGRSRYSKNNMLDVYRRGTNKVDLDYINSKEFKIKFDKLSSNSKLNFQIYRYAKAILINRHNTDHEDSYIFKDTGELVDQTISKKNELLQVTLSDSDLKNLYQNYEPWTLVGIHNHPTNVGPSGSDYAVANSRRYKFGVVITHDGEVYKYSFKNSSHMYSYSIDKTIDRLRESNYNEDEIISELIKRFGKKGLICEKMK